VEVLYPKVEVVWIDTVSHSEWMDKFQISKLKPANCRTRGYLFVKNKQVTVLFASVTFNENEEVDNYGDITVIPTPNVIEIIEDKKNGSRNRHNKKRFF
tara:strand:- start:630 stop:926 length:297 start_codon:yes stop_codon:yes gene_type:complete